MSIAITLSIKNPAQKYIHVRIDFKNINNNKLILNFPTWTPGSYVIREYAQNLEDIKMTDSKNRSIKHKKTNKYQWVFANICGNSATLTYKIYANQLSVQGIYLDHELAFITPCAAFFHIENNLTQKVTLNIKTPPKWNIAIAKQKKQHLYQFNSFDELYDTPILIAKKLTKQHFKINNNHYQIAYWGDCFQDLKKVTKDIKRFIIKENNVFKKCPANPYLFQIIFTKQAPAGGLEHSNCSTNIFDGSLTHNLEVYIRLIKLLAHEYFHLWNVKRICPADIKKVNYTKESYTKDLWLAEGMTSYYDQHILMRANFYDEKQYLQYLSDNIIKLEANKAGKINTLSDASFDTWIRWYQPNANTFNRTTSYYHKGALICMLFDFWIIKKTMGKKNLDHVMKELFSLYLKNPKKGITRKDFFDIVYKVTKHPFHIFAKKHLDNLPKINWKKEFTPFGIDTLKKYTPNKNYLGLILYDNQNHVYVHFIAEDSPAFFSDLQPQDEIIAINNTRITSQNDLDQYLHLDTLKILFSRRSKVMTTTIKTSPKSVAKYELKIKEKLTKEQKTNLKAFLRKL